MIKDTEQLIFSAKGVKENKEAFFQSPHCRVSLTLLWIETYYTMWLYKNYKKQVLIAGAATGAGLVLALVSNPAGWAIAGGAIVGGGLGLLSVS